MKQLFLNCILIIIGFYFSKLCGNGVLLCNSSNSTAKLLPVCWCHLKDWHWAFCPKAVACTYRTGDQKYFLCTGMLVSCFCTVILVGLLLEFLFGTRISRIYFDTVCVLCHPVEFLLSSLLFKNVVNFTRLFKRPILQL